MWTMDEVPKTLILNGHTYYLRGNIILNSGLRTGLRVASTVITRHLRVEKIIIGKFKMT
jgi:hypothetical protein